MNKEVVFHTCRICQSTAYNQVRMCKGASSDFYFWQKDFISSVIKFCVEFSGNNLQDPTGLQGLSHGYQADIGMVQTLLRFSWTPVLPCNGRDRSSIASHLICQFSDGDTTILHHNSPQLLNDNLILGCWGLIRTCFTLQWCAAALEAAGSCRSVPLEHHQALHKIWYSIVVQVFPSFCQKWKSYDTPLHILTHQRSVINW